MILTRLSVHFEAGGTSGCAVWPAAMQGPKDWRRPHDRCRLFQPIADSACVRHEPARPLTVGNAATFVW